jgi:hypothetical protein
MSSPLLNLDLLRRATGLRPLQRRTMASEVAGGSNALTMSRRAIFGFAGVAAVDLSPLLKRLETSSLGSIEVVSSTERVAFRMGGKDRWVLDTRCFAGTPRLRLTRKPGRLRVELEGARLPGTPLPADLTCDLTEELLGWRMRLVLALGRFEADVPFEAWLLGNHRATSILADTPIAEIALATPLALEVKRTLAAFTPDWTLRCEGPGAAVLRGRDIAVPAGTVELAVLTPESASLMVSPAERRTLVSVGGAAGDWRLDGLLPALRRGALMGTAPFDVIHLELGEDASADRCAALLATCSDDRDVMAYAPCERLVAPDGSTLRLPLVRPRLAVALDGGKEERALVADFGPRPAWFDLDGQRFEVGRIAAGPPFELVNRGTESTLCCEPGLLAVLAPLAGAVTGKARPRPGTVIAFVGGPEEIARVAVENQAAPQPRPVTKPISRSVLPTPTPTPAPAADKAQATTQAVPAAHAQAAPAVRVPAAVGERAVVQVSPGALSVHLPTNLRVPVVRPDDLLYFELELVNLRVQDGAPPHLVRIDEAKPAHLVVHFPPQHIAEQAFFEVAAGYPVAKPGDPSAPEDQDKNTSPEPPTAPPVRTLLSGWSRLSFAVPPAELPLEYSLRSLLEAFGSLPLRVAPTALPPDRPAKIKPGRLGTSVSRERAAAAAPVATPGVSTRRPIGGAPMTADQPAAAGQRSTTAQLRVAPQGRRVVSTGPNAATVARPEAVVPGLIQSLAPREPDEVETAIEAPYRLLLSPHAGAAWAHKSDLVPGESGRVELWHTRLAVRSADGAVDEDDDDDRTVRAIWSPDYRVDNPPAHYGAAKTAPFDNPFRMTLDARDRHEIVPLTSDFTIPSYRPKPIEVERLMLSSLGAWMSMRGAWEPPRDPKEKGGQGLQLEVEEWRHRATMGRDHYVRVVYKGYLFPFGHRASLIKVTERKFRPILSGPQQGQIAAYLFQRMYIVVREPERDYTGVDFVNPAGEHYQYANPLRRVRLTTLVTPDLDPPENSDVADKAQQAFWPSVGTRPFLFHAVAWDSEGRASELTAPLLFVGAAYAHNEDSVLDAVKTDYVRADASGVPTRAQRGMAGQKVSFTEPAAGKPGGTALETVTLTFGAEIPTADTNARTPRFYPTVTGAKVKIPAVQAMSGAGDAPTITFSPVYLKNGFGGTANKAELWAQLDPKNMSPLRLGADQAGGIATPNMDIAGLSRSSGTVGGSANPGPAWLEDYATGAFNPKEFFGAAGAKILGGIGLADIIQSALSGGDGTNVPKLETKVLYPGDDESKLPNGIQAHLDWKPKVQSDPLGLFKPADDSVLWLDAKVVARIDDSGTPQTPEYTVHGELTNFKIDLIAPITSFLIVGFDKFTLDAGSGKKASVVPSISDVEFAGPLAFVNELRQILQGYGFDINVANGGVTASYTLQIPPITAGVMSLENISVSAAITIPFSGDPVRLRFAMCSRENPCLLRVYCFGGGGFVGISLGIDGVELLEFSFEFGACMSLDIGVASGSVYAMAGIYIKMESDNASLTGYLRMGGSLSILAIITLSIEFYMGLTYETEGNKVWGEARLTVEIEILFFSTSVELSVRREFADPELPKFADMMTAGEWQQYCEAFA